MAETVKFNVGGKHFEVSRALIEQTPGSMLAKMITETRKKEPDELIFIDRDVREIRWNVPSVAVVVCM